MLRKSRAIKLFVLLSVLLLGMICWWIYNFYNANSSVEDLTANRVACDYSTPCQFAGKLGNFWLSVNNPPIEAERWIYFNLQSELPAWQVVGANIVGKSMFMGRIPVFFESAGKRRFTAKSMVGACTSEQMIWQLQITVEADKRKEILLFDFTVRGR